MELNIGLCRALVAPWLKPLEWYPNARSAAAPLAETPTSPAAATDGAVEVPAASREPSTGASIIPFEHARARLSARK